MHRPVALSTGARKRTEVGLEGAQATLQRRPVAWQRHGRRTPTTSPVDESASAHDIELPRATGPLGARSADTAILGSASSSGCAPARADAADNRHTVGRQAAIGRLSPSGTATASSRTSPVGAHAALHATPPTSPHALAAWRVSLSSCCPTAASSKASSSRSQRAATARPGKTSTACRARSSAPEATGCGWSSSMRRNWPATRRAAVARAPPRPRGDAAHRERRRQHQLDRRVRRQPVAHHRLLALGFEGSVLKRRDGRYLPAVTRAPGASSSTAVLEVAPPERASGIVEHVDCRTADDPVG